MRGRNKTQPKLLCMARHSQVRFLEALGSGYSKSSAPSSSPPYTEPSNPTARLHPVSHTSSTMRLTFSNSNYRNGSLSDEHGLLRYRVDTPSAWNKKTTVTKYPQGGTRSQPPQAFGVIEWKRLKGPVVHFKGQTIEADALLTKRGWSSDRYFKGPDGRTYRWKIQSNCRLQSENSDIEVVKYHRRNVGIRKSSHSPYLEISSAMTHMLDEIVTTFVYAEKLSQDEERRAAAA